MYLSLSLSLSLLSLLSLPLPLPCPHAYIRRIYFCSLADARPAMPADMRSICRSADLRLLDDVKESKKIRILRPTAMDGRRPNKHEIAAATVAFCISCIIVTNHIRRDTNHHGSPTGNREGHREDGRLPGEISQPHPIWCVNFCLPWKRPVMDFWSFF